MDQSNHIYDEAIEFKLDSIGNFIPDKYEEVYGFERISELHRKGFTLTYDKAIRLTKQNGLMENDSVRATGYLQWECAKSNKIPQPGMMYILLIHGLLLLMGKRK